MFDDGLYNDGAANDNVYGVDVVINSSLMQYYFYAENSNIGKFSPTNAEHEFYELSATTQTIGDVVINEFLVSNDLTIADQDGEYDDWIEIYNKGTVAVDISGYTLTDDLSDFTLFAFPTGTSIADGEYIIVWADEDVNQTGYHADFKMSSNCESLTLTDASFTILDQVIFSEQDEDISYGRFPNGTGIFQIMNPTFQSENLETLNPTSIRDVNEDVVNSTIYPNPADNFFNIKIESNVNETELAKVYDVNGRI